MITVNNLHFDIKTFPDGQRLLGLPGFLGRKLEDRATIKISIKSYADFELLTQAVTLVRRFNPNPSLYITYLTGMRSDRRFSGEQVNYIRDVVAPAINSLNLSSVKILEPHSDVTIGCINNAEPFCAVPELVEKWYELFHVDPSEPFNVVFPDASAYKKYEQYFYGKNHLIGVKVRDISTGRITNYRLIGDLHQGPIIVVDDLCDGGATFIQVADLLPKDQHKTLIVTHGLFSKGIDVLCPPYDKIISTNSYQELIHPNLIQV